jgi:hypothetical protein
MAKSTKKPASTPRTSSRKTRTENDTPQNGAASAATATHTHEDIATRAYEIFLSRGAHHGRDVEDWLEAEAGVRNGHA